MKVSDDIKVFIGVTFRDFNGSDNDAIQRRFVESLRDQTYRNWRMVVTLFNEKLVEQEIGRYDIDAVFHRNGPVTGYKFSLTDVFLNTVEESRSAERGIILWTTCDVIFPPDFLERVVEHYSPGFFAVSHPHLTYASVADLASGKAIPTSINSGMDLVMMDAAVFRSPANLQRMRDYRYLDWGIFEHNLVGLARLVGTKRINLFGVASIAKVENDRVVGAETQAWLHRCWLANKNVIDRFIADNHLSKELLELPYCHMQFERVTGRIAHYRQFAGDYVAYYANRLKRRLAPMIPSTAKNVFRHAPR